LAVVSVRRVNSLGKVTPPSVEAMKMAVRVSARKPIFTALVPTGKVNACWARSFPPSTIRASSLS
jgi:hypothetical protein